MSTKPLPAIHQFLISPDEFSERILDYYHNHGRKDLPWQNTSAYEVWISEIMLQQTQVVTVIPYFKKFISRFPELQSLAAAKLDDVLHYWQGLGYYARARNLHRCARTLIEQFDGQFPDSLSQMQSLPGIGRSTAGAILSLAMKQSTPILDGNVKRVLSRVFLVDGWYGQTAVSKRLWELSETYTPSNQTAHFNQAMMDLGASLCSRSKPQCEDCPVKDGCLAFIHGRTHEYPHKKPKKQLPVRRATLNLIVNNQAQVQLEKRPPAGIWGGLWSLPEKAANSIAASDEQLVDEIKHTFTHFHLQMKIFLNSVDELLTDKKMEENPQLKWHNIEHLPELAFPTPIKKFLFQYFKLKNH